MHDRRPRTLGRTSLAGVNVITPTGQPSRRGAGLDPAKCPIPAEVSTVLRSLKVLPAVLALAALAIACPVASAHEVAPGGVLTHGPDPEPSLAEVTASNTVRASLSSTPPQKVECAGNGTSGKRVQVMYVRASNAPDNYAASRAAVAAGAIDADRVFRESSAETSGMRRIRFVHDAYCNLSILNVVLDPSALISGDLGPTSSALRALGYTSTDRKYLIFVDHAANRADDVNCGIGGLHKWDDQPGAGNASNGGPGFARVGPNCWNVTNSVAAHELMHNLGAVQNSAPNWNGVGHCLDDRDRMCYDQGVAGFTFNPSVCLNHERLFDCNHDDYFHTDPPAGNYLATHWNTADSQYLSSTPQDHWGFVHADDPTAASSYTPDLDRNQNSTATPNTVVRAGTGVYEVTFANLASYGARSGSAAASAVGTAGEQCTVSSWNSNATPDMTVVVRCFDAAGAPADTVFDASYIRPTTSSTPFAYLWAEDPAAASYTPSTNHQFNSTGATNTIVRHSTGDYTVTLPGLAASGGTVKVTAFSGSANSCKASGWDADGADEQVDVLCFDATGAPADVKFTLQFANEESIVANGASSGYVWANDAAAPSYTPNSAYQYNSTGATNTITRTATGRYTVTLPGLGSSLYATNEGIVHVTSHHTTSKRCELAGYRSAFTPPPSPIALYVDVACHTAAGTPSDSKFVVQFTR
jgi:hypothetical protein